jgi:hypothetical protein
VIVNIRGIDGSGKSTIVKQFLKNYPYVEIFGVLGPRRPEAYKVWVPGRPLYIVGSYLRITGGADVFAGNLGCSGEFVALLERYRKLGHVLFEGVVISTFYGAVGEWLKVHSAGAVVAFMDTSLAVCLEGIKARGGNNFKQVEVKVRMLEGAFKRFKAEGVRVEYISRENGYETIKGWLE